MEIGENETEKYENLIEEYKNVFHQNHFQVSPALAWQDNFNMFNV